MPPVDIKVEDLFGPAIESASSWIGLFRRNSIVAANKGLRDALSSATPQTRDLRLLLPCWDRHVGSSVAMTCPCPLLVERPTAPEAFCRATPPRSPARITSHEVAVADQTPGLRLAVLEPRLVAAQDATDQVSRAVMRIRSAIDAVELELLNEHRSGPAQVRPPGLSRREWDVAQALASGKRAPAVAHGLGISVHTVRNHVKAVYRKLNVSTQSELRRRLLTPPAAGQ